MVALPQILCDMFLVMSAGVLAQRLNDIDLKREINRVWPSLSQKTVDLLVTPHKCEPQFCLGSAGKYLKPLVASSSLFFLNYLKFSLFISAVFILLIMS